MQATSPGHPATPLAMHHEQGGVAGAPAVSSGATDTHPPFRALDPEELST